MSDSTPNPVPQIPVQTKTPVNTPIYTPAQAVIVQKTTSVNYTVGALAIGLIVGVLVSWIWLRTPKTSPADTAEVIPSNDANLIANPSSGTNQAATVPVTTTVQPQGQNTASDLLVIQDQPSGLSVSVAHASVDDSQWVVIHEDRMGGPGNALGAARFVGGATSGTVELLRGTTAGQTYHGLIYRDDGDHIFSMERDVPIRDSAGNPIQVTFKAN